MDHQNEECLRKFIYRCQNIVMDAYRPQCNSIWGTTSLNLSKKSDIFWCIFFSFKAFFKNGLVEEVVKKVNELILGRLEILFVPTPSYSWLRCHQPT